MRVQTAQARRYHPSCTAGFSLATANHAPAMEPLGIESSISTSLGLPFDGD
jgi:hypothetical protein